MINRSQGKLDSSAGCCITGAVLYFPTYAVYSWPLILTLAGSKALAGALCVRDVLSHTLHMPPLYDDASGNGLSGFRSLTGFFPFAVL